MKRYKSIIIALSIILVAVAAFFLLDSFVFDKNNGKPTDNTNGSNNGSATDESKLMFEAAESVDDVVKYECNLVDNIILERNEDNKWWCSSYAEIPINQNSIESDIDKVISCRATVVYDGELTDDIINNYGISHLEYVKITLDDGTAYTLCFGMKKQGSSSYFAMVKETNEIYLVNSTYKDYSIITLENIVKSDIFSFNDKGKIKWIYVQKEGKDFIELNATLQSSGRTWEMVYPIKSRGDDPHIEEIISIVTLVETNGYIEGDSQRLADYGLATPVYSISLGDSNQVQKLNIGNLIPEGNAYYCTIGNENDVFTVPKESFQFIDDSEIRYMNTYLHMQISQEIYKVLDKAEVKISCDDYEDSFVLGFEINDNLEKRYFESVLMETKEEINAFKHLNTAIYELNIVGLDEEPAEKGDLLITVTYTCKDGIYVIEGYRRDDTTMYLYMNDNYCGGYDYIRQITGSSNAYGIKGSVEELRKILE